MSEEEKQIMNKMIYCKLINGEQALKLNRHIKEILQENEQLKEQLQQKENIIKEVREYIESKKIYTNEKQEAYTLKNTWYGLELLGILEKEGK